MKKSLLSLAASAALLVVLSGCGTPGLTSSTTKTDAPVVVPPTTSAGAETTAGTTASAGQLNMFTGNYDLKPGESNRPMAIMVANDSRARPQYGLDQADLLVEAETEGGITRIMAVFANASRVPAQMAPIRSARTPFVLLAQSLDVVYAHFGGSPRGLENIKTLKIDAINGITDTQTFWRDPTLRKTKGLDHSAMTSGEKLTARIARSKYRTSTDRTSPYAFGSWTGTGTGKKIQVTFSGAQTVNFQYDAAKGMYNKFNGKLSSATAHKAASGAQLSAANVIVMYDEKYTETKVKPSDKDTYSFRLNSGTGVALSGGTSQPIKWSRTATRLSFTDASGKPLSLNKGKTYICLVTETNQSSTVLQ